MESLKDWYDSGISLQYHYSFRTINPTIEFVKDIFFKKIPSIKEIKVEDLNIVIIIY